MDEPQILGFSRDTDCMSLTSASASARRCAGSDLMKLATLSWVAFVLFSVIHALRFGNGNKLPGCVAVVDRPFSKTPSKELALPCWSQGNSKKTVAFRLPEKKAGRELQPLESSTFSRRTVSTIVEVTINAKAVLCYSPHDF